jgi:outer membrane protein OmpA-like peptidoglycan-associated protein
MEKWWVEKTPEPEEPLYIPIIKTLPPEVFYQTIVETDYIREKIYEQLPPEVIVQYVPQYFYQTVYEEITRDPTPAEIQEFINQLPPELIFQYLTDDQKEYIKEQIPPEVIIEQLPPEVVIQYVPEEVYEYIYETEYQTIYETIYREIERDPTEEEIQEYIKQLPPERILSYLTDEQIEYIKEQIPPRVIIQQLPPEIVIQTETVYQYIYETEYQTIYKEITRNPTPEEIQEFIKQLPPETIFQYLTDEQIQYIKDRIPPEVIIQQLPPQIWLQSILIADIEYIIFSGDATVYNVNSPTLGGTNLTVQEKATNDDIINVMAEALKSKDYMLILHGHANPVTGTAAEAVQLAQISLDRANSVSDRLKSLYTGDEPLDNRITTKGYGGLRNVSTTGSSAYSSLNRRVEAILFMIDVAPVSDGG